MLLADSILDSEWHWTWLEKLWGSLGSYLECGSVGLDLSWFSQEKVLVTLQQSVQWLHPSCPHALQRCCPNQAGCTLANFFLGNLGCHLPQQLRLAFSSGYHTILAY